MQRGKITILIILLVAVVAATFSVVYHFRNQQRAQHFWGTQTALLIDKAPTVSVLELREAEPGLSLAGDDDAPGDSDSEKTAPAEPSVRALEFAGIPWLIVRSREAAQSKGISNLRRALVLDTTYEWGAVPAEIEPHWHYGLEVEDGHNWGTVLFDFDSSLVGLAGGRHLARLNAEANQAFATFFADEFRGDSEPAAEAAGDGAVDGAVDGAKPADEVPPTDAQPAASPQ